MAVIENSILLKKVCLKSIKMFFDSGGGFFLSLGDCFQGWINPFIPLEYKVGKESVFQYIAFCNYISVPVSKRPTKNTTSRHNFI